MQSVTAKVIQCYLRACEVNHYYWTHTAADNVTGDKGPRVSIENLQRVVERLTRKLIKMDLVEFDGDRIRAELERYDDHFEIHVRQGQSEDWYRIVAVKEFWHALSDVEEDYSTDGVQTIRELVKYKGGFNWEALSAEARSEKLAELFALELLYPLEYRLDDLEAHKGGASIEEISKKRGVPPLWAERALDEEFHEQCVSNWKTILERELKFPPLEPLEGEVT